MKTTVYLGASFIVVTGVGVWWKVVPRAFGEPAVPVDPPSKRKSDAPQAGRQWFTAVELATVKALASVIVPPDGNGPGAAEADVAGQLDEMVAGSSKRQALYRTGLAAFDGVAMRRYQRAFAALGSKEQIELFSVVDGARLEMEKTPASILDKASRKVKVLYYYRWLGVTPAAAEFCHYIVVDVKERFYSSQLAWAWLGYEGPPFPLGYFSKPDNCSIHKV
jgi:hypothetical protein